ncbi:N-6 DNA methylase [Candidatus Halobeggiatoa sp. HSG11]|nr:N-6 DNA methylase [Candidatus Halobeggiatoa sp. HSG11]
MAVIELKGTNTKDLDKVNNQAFNYKNNHTDCVYVITSNFEKLRFFIHDAVAHIEFNLFTLTKEEFEILWLCLNAENLLGGVPAKIKQDSIVVEENITKKLYKDYSTFKNELWQNICKNRPDLDKLLLFQKTQKLLDRFLFVFFAEDSGLLPPNSISSMVKRYKQLIELDAKKPLYDIFKQFFGYINKGRKGKTVQDDIFAYNGGLFLPDELLDGLIIDDELLEPHVLTMTAYNFQSDVDVNILGHIFENSLNEIESVTAQLEGQKVDKNKSKRKKDGVFYTPKYITKYIVENTVGKLCEEKKADFGIVDEEYAKGQKRRRKKLVQNLYDNLQEYRNWLLEITICDPACGSGAFLNQALEFLISEHAYVDELQAYLLESSIVFQDVSNHVLERNIFGVDINEESVDIAKLSLWLRTAQRGRKLTSLNNNIKCGNSLIDDPKVAGEKAFNWEEEFPQVFEKGGFDVVIGNPPYVNFKLYSSFERNYYKKQYSNIFNGKADLLYYFYYFSIEILKNNGVLGFITSRYWLEAEYAILLRNEIKRACKIIKILDFKNLTIFEDAGVKSNITILRKNITLEEHKIQYYDFYGKKIFDIDSNTEVKKFNVNQSSLLINEDWKFFPHDKLNLLNKLKIKGRLLDCYCHCLQGVITGADKIFVIEKNNNHYNEIEDIYTKKWIKVGDINRYSIMPVVERKVIYTEKIDINNIPHSVYNCLNINKNKLKNRSAVINGEYSWISWHRYRNKKYINQPKLVTRFKAAMNTFAIDMENCYSSADVTHVVLKEEYKNQISLNYLCGILNSKLLDVYFKSYGKLMDYRYEYYPTPVGKMSIILGNTEQQINISENVQKITELTNILIGVEISFVQLLKSKYISVKDNLSKYYNLDFSQFLKELEKARKKSAKENKQEYKKLSLSEEAEWMEYFNDQKQKAQELKEQINQTDKEIDKMVYELYELTPEEIEIVENSVK